MPGNVLSWFTATCTLGLVGLLPLLDSVGGYPKYNFDTLWQSWTLVLLEVKVELIYILCMPSRMDFIATIPLPISVWLCSVLYLRLLTPVFVTWNTDMKAWKPEMKHCHQASYGKAPHYTGGGTHNEILCLYDKISITTVRIPEKSLVFLPLALLLMLSIRNYTITNSRYFLVCLVLW